MPTETMSMGGVKITRERPGLYRAEIRDVVNGRTVLVYQYGSLPAVEGWVREKGRSVPPVLDLYGEQQKEAAGGPG